jgi:hypothetical protein
MSENKDLPEYLSESAPDSAEQEIIQADLKDTNMEVHHHPDLHHKSKPWKEYFLEFLMIFLAVTLGFFAENVREYFTERKAEKEFAIQLINGLKQDTVSLNWLNLQDKIQAKTYDSIITELNLPIHQINWEIVRRGIPAIEGMPMFVAQKASFDQIQNSGTLRYFKNEKIVSFLIDHKNFIDLIKHQQEMFISFSNTRLEPFITNHFDESQVNFLRTGDAVTYQKPFSFLGDTAQILIFKNLLVEAKEKFELPQTNLQYAYKESSQLLSILKKEYELE